MRRLVFLISVLAFLVGCDGGLAPPPPVPVQPGISGSVVFKQGSWPPQDSLVNLWVFASQLYPLDSSTVFAGIVTGHILIFPGFNATMAFYVDSTDYFFPLPPGAYKYTGVIQRFRNDLNIRSFRVVGFYHSPSDTSQPLAVEVREGQVVRGVNIDVDFHHPPTQPF